MKSANNLPAYHRPSRANVQVGNHAELRRSRFSRLCWLHFGSQNSLPWFPASLGLRLGRFQGHLFVRTWRTESVDQYLFKNSMILLRCLGSNENCGTSMENRAWNCRGSETRTASKKGNALDNSLLTRTRALQRELAKERRGQTLNTYPSEHWAPLQHRARFTTPAAQVHLSQMVLSDFFWKKIKSIDSQQKRCMSDDYESNPACFFFIFDSHKFNFIIR